MEKFIDVVTEDGRQFKAEVINIFGLDEYPGKDYIMYSFGESVDEDNEKVYVSILEDKDEEYKLQEISDPTEWSMIQEAIDNYVKNEGEVNE